MTTTTQLVGTYTHGVNERLDYSIDWRRTLEVGEDDAIATSTWITETGSPTIGNGSNGAPAASFSGSVTSVWIVDGTANDLYVLTNRITTSGGRRYEASIQVTVVDPYIGATLSTARVSADRTFFGDGFRATNMVSVPSGFAGVLALVPHLPSGTVINALSTVVIDGPVSVTATNLRVAADGVTAHWTMPSLTTDGVYSIKATVTTNDSQTIPTICTLKVV